MGVLKGLDEVLRKLDAFPKNLEVEIEKITEANTREVARSAKRFAPYDLGFLKNSITVAKGTNLSWKVFVLAPYAAYQEFGTGGLVNVPEEMREIARKFIGKGVRQIDMRPQPFLYPSLELQRPVYLKDLENLLQRELDKI